MKFFLLTLFALLVGSLAYGSTNIITATVTVTAGTTNGQTITVNGTARTWTNQFATTLILTNSTTASTCSNLFLAYVSYPETRTIVTRPTSTSITLQGYPNAPMAVSVSAGWATVVLSTNSIGTPRVSVYAPYASGSAAEQTNITSDITAMVSANASTNRLNVWGYFMRSNSLSQWPTAPLIRGDAFIGSSNGYPYVLLSTNGAIGSAAWTATNKLGW